MAWHDPQDRHPDPLPSEFSQWLTPEECFGHLPEGMPSPELVNRLLRRLVDGKLIAAASESWWREAADRKTRFLATAIDPSWWLNAQDAQSSHSDLWRTGECSCLIECDDDDAVRVNFYGVKFEPGEMFHTVPGLKQARLFAKLPPLPPEPLEPLSAVREALANAPPPLTQDVLDSWEPVAGLLKRFEGLSDQDALDWLWGRLVSGQVVAGAEMPEEKPGEFYLVRVPAKWWGLTPVLNNVHQPVWNTGDGTLNHVLRSHMTKTTTLKAVRLHNIRIEPDGLRKAAHFRSSVRSLAVHPTGALQSATDLSDPLIQVPTLMTVSQAMAGYAGKSTPTPKRDNPVTSDEIKVWHRGLSRAEKSLGVTALWERARADHPGRHLPRKMVEHFGRGRGNGHRAKA